MSVASMDRVIEKKKPATRWLLWLLAGGGLLGIVIIVFALMTSGSRLKVAPDRLTIATVSEGEFQEFIPITGEVLPVKTVFIDAIEGGQVRELYMEGGELVKKGDMILRLSNPSLELSYMNLQTQLLEQMNNLRNSRILMEEQGLNLRDQLIQINQQIAELEQRVNRNRPLYRDSVIAEADFITMQNNLIHNRERGDLMRLRIRKDSLLRTQQVGQVDMSMDLIRRNLSAIDRSLDNLTIRAPIEGQLSSVRVEIGETVRQGQNLGQIDILDGYKVRASIDEHYISRVRPNQVAEFVFAGQSYALVIRKVYPEVRNGSFEVDMDFEATPPAAIKRGQNLQIRLALSNPSQAIMVPRGGFYQSTGGNYIYVLSPDEKTATKRSIRIDKQSDRFYEVTEGLSPGEKVIVSGYESFNNASTLVFE